MLYYGRTLVNSMGMLGALPCCTWSHDACYVLGRLLLGIWRKLPWYRWPSTETHQFHVAWSSKKHWGGRQIPRREHILLQGAQVSWIICMKTTPFLYKNTPVLKPRSLWIEGAVGESSVSRCNRLTRQNRQHKRSMLTSRMSHWCKWSRPFVTQLVLL